MKHVIIGGTHGLGHEIAAAIQHDGGETFVTGRSYSERKHGDGFQVDLTRAAGARSLENALYDLQGEIASFYWVSGYGYNGDFAEQVSPEAMAAVNFGNVLPAAQAAFKRMNAANFGNFVVVSSTTGVTPRNNEAVYAGTKAAQVYFTRSLGLEVERLESDVQVALFMPGGMQTEFWDGNRPDSYDQFLQPQRVAAHILERVAAQDALYYEEMIPRGSL